MRVPLNITGASYSSRSLPLSAQATKNFYPELQDDPFTKSNYVLMPTPGYKSFGSDSGTDRGMLEHKGVLYKVSGINLHTVNSAGVHTSVGEVQGSKQVVMAGINDNVVIATGEGLAYQYDGATVTQLTDTDLEAPTWVAHINNVAIWGGLNGRFAASAVGDATDINGLDYATAEIDADALIRGYTFQQRLYLFGTKTTEIWQFSGVGRPPLDRIPNASQTIGIAARVSAAHNDQYLYFLGDDRRVYRTTQGAFESVSDIGLSNEFEGYTTVSDAVSFCYTFQGQNFYHIAFPTEDRSWVYSENVSQWFELNRSGSTGRGPCNSHAWVYGKNLVSDYRDSNIYELDVSTYTENGNTITRVRDTAPLHSGLLGSPGSEIELNRFELIMEKGTGSLTGQGSNPKVMLQISTDGGRTFGTEIWENIGMMAQFHQKVVWSGLGRFESGIIRVTTSDPVFYSIHSAAADLELVL